MNEQTLVNFAEFLVKGFCPITTSTGKIFWVRYADRFKKGRIEYKTEEIVLMFLA